MTTARLVDSTLDQLKEALRSIAPEALLVEPRILRRVIRLDRRLAGLGISIPHGDCYTIETARLLAYVEWDELNLPPTTDLPWKVILLAEPADLARGDGGASVGPPTFAAYSQHLFHARLHMELERRLPPDGSSEELIAARIAQIGALEFAEIRSVLLRDDRLFPDPTDREVYIEFVAAYFEGQQNSAVAREWQFPCVRDWERIEAILSQDVRHAELWRSSQLPLPELPQPAEERIQDSEPATSTRHSPFRIRARRQLSRALQAVSRGNGIRAAILRTRLAAEQESEEHVQAAVAELQRVIQRLQPILQLQDHEVRQWTAAFEPLLVPATKEFWAVEARLLYDLQKVCVEYERGVFQVNLINWCRTLGKSPLRIPLPLLREVLITKHLRSALSRVASTRIPHEQREKIADILQHASTHAESRARNRIRPLITEILDRVGLVPQNLPERIARRNVVEELLDHIVEQGVANLGHLRDSLSKNDIKLPDLAGAAEFLHGDLLLRVDRQLGRELGGVYRPGAIYLRSTQRLSSIAFGTPTGRWLTKYLAIPYGGAYVVLEGLRHLIVKTLNSGVAESTERTIVPELPFLGAIAVLGTWLLLLLHYPRFRLWFVEVTLAVWRVVRIALVDIPGVIVRSSLVRDVLRSPAYAAFRSYLLVPGLVTLILRGTWGQDWSGHLLLESFLFTALVLNSRVGRYVEERVGDLMIRLWHDLRIRIFAAVYDWVMDVFHRIFVGLERVIYSVDEFLRFRAGDTKFVSGIKLVAGTFWSFVSYIVVFAFTLLIEPQINPIKHFPVVTVSHKFLLPAAPMVVNALKPYVGDARAQALVWSTIFLIPGVFGFLVWELKENWRLYVANRPRYLTPIPIGHHGETVLRFLRVGFHSGTIPKLFRQLRQALRHGNATDDWKPFQRKLVALHHVEESIHRFIDRKLLWLWSESGRLPADLRIAQSHLATNRIEVVIHAGHGSSPPLVLRWDEFDGRLTASADLDVAAASLSPDQSRALAMSLSGIFRLAGAEGAQSPLPLPALDALPWLDWVDFWTPSSNGPQQSTATDVRDTPGAHPLVTPSSTA